MRNQRAPLFVARRAYRQRRITDAARLLPIVGILLLLVPFLWRPAATGAADTVKGSVYLFAVWGGLIIGAGLLARLLGGEDAPDETDGQDAP